MAVSAMGRRLSRLALLHILGSRRPAPWPEHPRSILIARPDHLGDLILATPALRAVRQAFPDAHLTAWIGPWGGEVWRDHPCLDGMEIADFPGFTRRAKPSPWQPYVLAQRWAGRLAGRYDLAINLRPDFWWGALVASWAGIAVAGFDLPECRPFLTLSVPYQAAVHETDRSLRLVAAVARQAGRVEDQRGERAGQATAQAELASAGELFPEAPLPAGLPQEAIAIHPGAGAGVKLWREEAWATVADSLAAEGQIVFTAGSVEEVALVGRVRAQMRRPSLGARPLALADLAGFYRRCRLMLAPDCGPLHLARAVGAPTVGLFGPTDPVQFGPRDQGSPKHAVVRLGWPCIPCRRLDYTPRELALHPCVALIEPREVIEAARRVLHAQMSRP